MISVKNIYKDFGSLRVLKGVSCDIEKGEKIVVVGPSGSGKSTFLRCINLLEQPTYGEVWVDDDLVTPVDPYLHFDVICASKTFQKLYLAERSSGSPKSDEELSNEIIMKIKKTTAIILSLGLCLPMLTACGNSKNNEKDTSSKNSNSEKSAVSSGSDMSVSDKEASIESSTELSEPFEKKETTETTESIEPSEDIIKEYDDGQQYEEQTEEESEDETVEDKPSLEEFLRGLRCSGCRHNCTLFSPRCMNGARKASQAESQYNEMYNM